MDANSLGRLHQSFGAGVRSMIVLRGLLQAFQAIRNTDRATVEWSVVSGRLPMALDAGGKLQFLAKEK